MVAIDLEAFEREGYAVLRGFMPRAQTRALRALMDSTLGPPAETVAEHVATWPRRSVRCVGRTRSRRCTAWRRSSRGSRCRP